MADKLNLGVEIDKKLIEDNVTKLVASAIAEALGDKEKLINDAVKSILMSYVNEAGEPCSASSWHARPYLQHVAESTVKKAVREQIAQSVEEHKDAFANELKRQISTKTFQSSVAASFLKCVLGAAESSWKMPITVSFDSKEDD